MLDIVAAPAPSSDAAVESGKDCAIGGTPLQETAGGLQVGKRVEPRPGADGPAVSFDEMHGPGIAVMLKVEHDPGHDARIGPWSVNLLRPEIAVATWPTT